MHRYGKISLAIVVTIGIIAISFLVIAFVETLESCHYDMNAAIEKFNTNENKSDIVVSLTTMPLRLQSDELKHCLHNIFNQTMRPKEIRFNIPYISKRTGSDYIIPDWLTQIPITIVRCEDYGPATKYLPTLQYFANQPNQKIVIYDDDSYMPEDLIFEFDRLSSLYPNYCFTAHGYRLLKNSQNPNVYERLYIFGKKDLIQKFFDIFRPSNTMEAENNIELVDIVTGWAGYCLTPNMLQYDDVAKLDVFPKDAFFVDDVMISAAILKNNTKIVVGKGLRSTKKTIYDLFNIASRTSTEALSNTVNSESSHDHVMELYFQKYWQFLH